MKKEDLTTDSTNIKKIVGELQNNKRDIVNKLCAHKFDNLNEREKFL